MGWSQDVPQPSPCSHGVRGAVGGWQQGRTLSPMDGVTSESERTDTLEHRVKPVTSLEKGL